MTDQTQSAIVIGAGIAGLATAALLQSDGYRVTVLEARHDTGGRAGTWERDGFRFDTGPSWYLMPEVFDHFFRLLGTSAAEQLDLVRLDPGYRVFFEGQAKPMDIRADRSSNIALFETTDAGAGPALTAYLDSAGDAYRLATSRFLYSTYQSMRPFFRRETLRLLPRLAPLLTQSLERFVAKRFRDPRLRQILGYPAVFLGSAPSMTPSLYHLMSHLDLEDGVWYPLGGFGAFIAAVRRLAEHRGVEIQTDSRVVSILTAADVKGRDWTTGVAYEHRGERRVLHADVVVSTADLHHTETELLPERVRSYPESWWTRRVPGPSAVLVLLGVAGRLPALAHHSLFFTEDWDDGFARIFGTGASIGSPTSLYVSRTSATDPTAAPPGHENLFVLVPVPADPGLGRGGVDGSGDPAVEAIADEAIRQVSEWAGIPDLAERIVVRRTIGPADFADDLHSWRGGALGPAHTLRQSAFLRGSNASAKVDGLYYAGGTTVPGIGLPMCLISAELVLKRLRGDITTTPLPEPIREPMAERR